jgi:dsDNA-binding SOS-regulon protein
MKNLTSFLCIVFKIKLLWVLTFLLLGLTACQQQNNQNQETTNLDSAALAEAEIWEQAQTQLDTIPAPIKILMLRDSAIAAWDSLMRYEEAKLLNIKVLVRDLPTIEGFKDQRSLDKIASLGNLLEKNRYNQTTMTDNKVMDTYDNALQELENLVGELSAQMVELERYPVQKEAVEMILAGKTRDIIVRQRYISFATAYNELLAQKQAELIAAGGEVAMLKPLPIFAYATNPI